LGFYKVSFILGLMANILVLDASPISGMIIQYWFPNKTVEFKSIDFLVLQDIPSFISHYKAKFPNAVIFCFTHDKQIQKVIESTDANVCFEPLFNEFKFKNQIKALLS
jgi:hypothetical protein